MAHPKRPPRDGVQQQQAREALEFSHAKKVERKILKSFPKTSSPETPPAPSPAAPGRALARGKREKGKWGTPEGGAVPRGKEEKRDEKQERLEDFEEMPPPSEDEASSSLPSSAPPAPKPKTPPPNLSIFKGGVVCSPAPALPPSPSLPYPPLCRRRVLPRAAPKKSSRRPGRRSALGQVQRPDLPPVWWGSRSVTGQRADSGDGTPGQGEMGPITEATSSATVSVFWAPGDGA
jgi:hypothetical protein